MRVANVKIPTDWQTGQTDHFTPLVLCAWGKNGHTWSTQHSGALHHQASCIKTCRYLLVSTYVSISCMCTTYFNNLPIIHYENENVRHLEQYVTKALYVGVTVIHTRKVHDINTTDIWLQTVQEWYCGAFGLQCSWWNLETEKWIMYLHMHLVTGNLIKNWSSGPILQRNWQK